MAPETDPINPSASDRAKTLLHTFRIGAEQRGATTIGDTEHAVLRYTLRHFPRVGGAPTRQDLARALDLSIDRVSTALQDLDTRDLVYLDPQTHEIRIAYPFSGTPTVHEVDIRMEDRRRRMFAVCAVDALGISFLLHRDVAITSSCPSCDKPIAMAISNGRITGHEPLETVVWVGTDRRGHAVTSVCQTMNFFCSDAHLASWRDRCQAYRGHRLALGEALYLGKGVFEALLEHVASGIRRPPGPREEKQR